MLRIPELLTVLYVLIAGTVIAGNEDLIKKYETDEKKFQRYEIGDKIVYFHQRMIDSAIVEKDFINYQFDIDTLKLINKTRHWRDGLPEHITIKIKKKEAESMSKGVVTSSELYIISPESDVFPLDPVPENPCWVVRSISNNGAVITIIDAFTGEFQGHGLSPPKK